MKIIGVDPGTQFTGYGIIEVYGNYIKLIDFGLINLKKYSSIPEKLSIIYNTLNEKIKLYKPDEFSLETAFYSKNVQSTLKIGYARGAAMLSAVHNNLPLYEYAPREIKKSVVGKGAASKEQVHYMVTTLLNAKKLKIHLDSSDALAAAICHSLKKSKSIKNKKGWKSFIEQNPERVIK